MNHDDIRKLFTEIDEEVARLRAQGVQVDADKSIFIKRVSYRDGLFNILVDPRGVRVKVTVHTGSLLNPKTSSGFINPNGDIKSQTDKIVSWAKATR